MNYLHLGLAAEFFLIAVFIVFLRRRLEERGFRWRIVKWRLKEMAAVARRARMVVEELEAIGERGYYLISAGNTAMVYRLRTLLGGVERRITEVEKVLASSSPTRVHDASVLVEADIEFSNMLDALVTDAEDVRARPFRECALLLDTLSEEVLKLIYGVEQSAPPVSPSPSPPSPQ